MSFIVGDKVSTQEGSGSILKVEPGHLMIKLDAGHFLRAEIDKVKRVEKGKE